MIDSNEVRIDGRANDDSGSDTDRNNPDRIVKARIDNNPDKIRVSEIINKIKKNPGMIVSAVLAIMVIILGIMVFRGGITGGVIGVSGGVVSADEAGAKAVEFINTQLLPPGQGTATLGSVSELAGLYEVLVNFQGTEGQVYVTKNLEFFIQGGLLPMDEEALNKLKEVQQPSQTQETQEPATSEYSEEDLVKIKDFSDCLAEKDFKVYGAGWCLHCQNLIKYFGGKEIIAPVYIECSDADRNPTENEELCEKEGIRGFPTIKINSIVHEGDRTFESFAEATGCIAPELS